MTDVAGSRPHRGQDPVPRIGVYRILSSLGEGGMGQVYLAWDERLERHVALKRLRADAGDPQHARLRREARAVARLSHPAIVRIYDLLDAPEGEYLVMEYVEGSTLTELVSKRQLDLRHAVELARELAEGLAEAHTKGLVHRDLKSDNVIVTADGHARILDFGLARLLWQARSPSVSDELTPSGALVGTVHAMSPEQAAGRAVDHRSDLFSLGILIYEMLTGRSPFRGDNLLDTLSRIAGEEPLPIRQMRPDVPPELGRLVERLLTKDPDHRPQNARLVTMELQALELPHAAVTAAPGPAHPPTAGATNPRLPRAVDANSPTASGIHLAVDAPAGPAPADASRIVLRTLVLTEIVDWSRRIEELGDQRGAEVWSRHDRMARDLAARHHGSLEDEREGRGVLEIEDGEGFFFLFERPFDAVTWVLAYHRGLAELSDTLGVELEARAVVHLGEVVLRRNPPADVLRGARPFAVEGLARLTAGRVLPLATAGQTLLTRSTFDLARRASAGKTLRWLAHGRYLLRDLEDPLEIFEVGVPGQAPLAVPPDSEHARRAVAINEEITLGWRPAGGQTIPRRPNWRLVERLGEGGFGEVWLARHKSGDQRVFKFCFEAERLGALKREVTLFRLLRDTLGQRDDITRIIDWNLELAPYFVESEHTEGGDLVRWAEAQGGLAAVPLATRLELVAGVAEALHAAHSVGILHKDVKPANVLVLTDGEHPRARLTDFGLGLLTERERLESHGITALGFSATATAEERSSGGTWHYMAPELTAGRPTTIQADIYSLGVMLYQVIAGDFQRSLAPGWQRDISDEFLAEDVAALVDGSPERRPASALLVAERLRGLDERRQRRQAQRAAERAAERTARRRRIATVAGTVSTFVLALVSLFAIDAIRSRDAARDAHREAERRRGQAEELIDFMLGDLRERLEGIGRLDVLDEVGKEAMDYFARVPEENLSADELMNRSKALGQLGHVWWQQKNLQDATEAFRRSLALISDLAARDPENPERQWSLAQSHFWTGYLLLQTRELEGALTHFETYRDIAAHWTAHASDDPKWQLELAYAHSNLASVLTARADPDGALEELATSTALLEDLAARDPASSLFQLELSHVYSKMGTALQARGRPRAALERYRNALGIHGALVEAEPENFQRLRYLATTHEHLGDVLLALGQPRRALEHYRADLELAARLAERDPENRQWRRELGISHANVGVVLRTLGELESAEDQLRRQLAILEDLNRADPRRSAWRAHLASSHNLLASVLVLRGSPQTAAHHLQQAHDILRPLARQQPGDGDIQRILSTNLWWLGQVRAALGDHRQARTSWEEAAATIEPFTADSHDPLFLVPLAQALLALGRIDQVRPVVEELWALGYREREFTELCRSWGLLPATAEPFFQPSTAKEL